MNFLKDNQVKAEGFTDDEVEVEKPVDETEPATVTPSSAKTDVNSLFYFIKIYKIQYWNII